MTTKEKFLHLCYTISNDTGNKYDYWHDLLEIYKNETDFLILKSKINNFVKLLNENDKEWFDKDVELEIYELV